MVKGQITWKDIFEAATSIFNITGTNKEIAFAQNVWHKLSDLGLASYSNNFEKVKIKILFLSLGVLYKDFCNIAYDKHTLFNYNDLLNLINIDEFILGRFYQENIKPKESKLLYDFNSSNALEELSKYYRKDIYKLLLKVFGSSNSLFISLWRSTYPYSNEDNLKDYEIIFNNLTPAKTKAFNWIEDGCYVILDKGEES